MRVRARSLYYIAHVHVREQFYIFLLFSRFEHQIPLKIAKNFSADYQRFTKKMHFYVHFFAKIFGQFKKKLYLCTRF